jgi:hypothetical protein
MVSLDPSPGERRGNGPSRKSRFKNLNGADLVALILALALSVALLIYSSGVLYEVVENQAITEIPPNSSQVLTLIFGGILGLLGSYVGFREAADFYGKKHDDGEDE